MRILQACVRYPPAPGGAETHVQALSEGLLARGHEVQVVTSDLRKEVPFTRDPSLPEEVAGVPVTRLPAWTPGGEGHYVFQRRLLRTLLREAQESDVVHAHSYGYHQTWAGALAARITDTPFVLTPHYHPPWSMEGGARRGILRRVYDTTLGPLSLRGSDAVLGVSRAELDAMEAHGLTLDPDRVHVVPNGIHMDRFTPPPDGERFREAFPEVAGPMVLYAGRLATNKGLPVLVDAIPDLVSELPDLTVVLAGEDQDQATKLQRQAEDLGVGDHLLVPGHLPEEVFVSAFGAADAFALPSEYEAFGIVLLEALACGLPCVVADRGGMPEVVEGGATGRVVPYGDPEALARGLLDVLEASREDDGPRVRSRERVAERFTWDVVVEEVEDVYHSLLSEGSR